MWAIELLWGVLLLEIAESLWENTDSLEASLSEEAAFLQMTVDTDQICATHNLYHFLPELATLGLSFRLRPTLGVFKL